jgi:hypothetical protein
MAQLVQTVSVAAASFTVAIGLWRGWGTFAVLKRAALAYLCFFVLGALLLLLVRSGALGTRREGGQDT